MVRKKAAYNIESTIFHILRFYKINIQIGPYSLLLINFLINCNPLNNLMPLHHLHFL